MKMKGCTDSFWDIEVEKMVDLVKAFLALAEDLLIAELITKEQYDEMTYNKIEFLRYLENKCVKKEYTDTKSLKQ